MELSSIHHIEPEKLADFRADLFICALSQEPRCTVISDTLKSLDCRKVALFRDKHAGDAKFRINKTLLQAQGCEMVQVGTDVPDISRLLGQHTGTELRMIIDCSSMSQQWYYEFFRWFSEDQEDIHKVHLRFVYCLSEFVEDETPRKVKGVREFLEIQGRRKRRKQALILGLGHEPNVGSTIARLEKPDLLFLYYADPAVERRFVEQVFVNNHGLISETPIRNLVAYPIRNGQAIYQSLIDTILPIRNEYEITLIPQGPKIFSVASMLVHLGYPDTRISYPVFKRTHAAERQPCGEPVILDVCFEGEE
jgi:hypothetical protein